jgi:hypothetical protein
MTEDEYWAVIRRSGYNPTKIPGIFMDRDGNVRTVPHPRLFTPEQRIVVVNEYRKKFGSDD